MVSPLSGGSLGLLPWCTSRLGAPLADKDCLQISAAQAFTENLLLFTGLKSPARQALTNHTIHATTMARSVRPRLSHSLFG